MLDNEALLDILKSKYSSEQLIQLLEIDIDELVDLIEDRILEDADMLKENIIKDGYYYAED